MLGSQGRAVGDRGVGGWRGAGVGVGGEIDAVVGVAKIIIRLLHLMAQQRPNLHGA